MLPSSPSELFFGKAFHAIILGNPRQFVWLVFKSLKDFLVVLAKFAGESDIYHSFQQGLPRLTDFRWTKMWQLPLSVMANLLKLFERGRRWSLESQKWKEGRYCVNNFLVSAENWSFARIWSKKKWVFSLPAHFSLSTLLLEAKFCNKREIEKGSSIDLTREKNVPWQEN